MIAPITETKKTKAAGAATPTALRNPNLNYAPLATLVQSNIDGQRLAGAFLEGLESYYCDSDGLYLAVKSMLSHGQDIEALTTLRGFFRIIQKRLERGAV